MMKTAPTLRLHALQVAQLTRYCTLYRSYLWQCVLPTPERNQMVRRLQVIQGRLEKVQEQGATEINLPLTAEEKATLQQLFRGLTQCTASEPPSEQRTRKLTELTTLRMHIERLGRQTSAL
jgi:hypothetical protein